MGFTLIASTMRVMNGKSEANKITPESAGARPLGRSVKVVSVREKNPEHSGGFRRDSPSHLCVYLSVLRHVCFPHSNRSNFKPTHTHRANSSRANGANAEINSKNSCAEIPGLTPLNIFTLT